MNLLKNHRQNSLQKYYIYIIMLIFVLISSCKESDLDIDNIEPPKFHSEKDEGYWKGKSNTHMPIITISDNNPKEIEVAVPLKQKLKPRHYIEVIALLQNGKQIEAVKLNPSKSSPIVKFNLPDSNYKSYSVVIKCNLHDMWRSPLVK